MRGHASVAWRRAPVWVLGALLLTTTVATADTPPEDRQERRSLAGLPLTEALLELEARGLQLVFTSRLVRPEMRVLVEPSARDPRQILDEILAPHGLAVEEAEGGTLVVVAVKGVGLTGRSITGLVRSRETLEPLAGVVIRVWEPGVPATSPAGGQAESGADGRFEVTHLEPGVYTLEAHLPSFLVAEVSNVTYTGQPVDLTVELRPIPFVSDEIVVRPSELSLLGEEPVAPLSLSRNEIEALPHLGGDVFRALSLLPGTSANDFTAQFHIHGGRRDEVQIMLDGQELYDAFHLKDFDSALGIVAQHMLSDVSLSTGAFPAESGDRMSGVLDITTQTPGSPRRVKLGLSLFNASGMGSGTFHGERGGWLASGRRGSIDLASRILGNEDPSFWDLFGKMDYRLGDRHQLRGHLLYAGDVLDFQETIGEESKRLDTDYSSSYLWLTHQAAWSGRLFTETIVSASRIDRDRRGVEDEEEQSFDLSDRRDFEIGAVKQAWDWKARGGHDLRWGFEARHYDAVYDYSNDIELDVILSTPLNEQRETVVDFEGRFRGEHFAAFVTDRFSPAPPLTLELGLRYDRHTLTDDTLVSPRANLAWRLTETSVVRLAWGHFYQSQRPYELQIEDGETSFFTAERSEHWVLGYERLFGGGRRVPVSALRIEGYRRNIRDPRPRYENIFEPTNTFPEVEPDRVRLAAQSSRSEGIELLLRGAAGPRVDWWATYAFASIEDELGEEEETRWLTDQPHTVNAIANIRLPKSWNLNLAWRFHTGWPTTPAFLVTRIDDEGEAEPVPTLGPLNSRRLDDYHRLDLRASRRFSLRSSDLTFFIDVQNVYSRRNLAGFDLDIDDEGEEPVLILEAESWPGFFPSVGISWEF